MNITNIINTDDMFLEITSYLTFEDRVIFSKAIKKNCLRTYDFNSKKFQNRTIHDIFNLYNEENDDEFCEHICELCSQFTCDMSDYYDEYYGYDEEDFMNDEYNNIPFERYRELSELFHTTYTTVYSRKIIEYIENNNLSISYYDYDFFQLEDELNIDTYDLIIEYYKYVFDNEDIDVFCNRCGLFGHHNASKECIFYNIKNENKMIKQGVKETINSITNKIIDNHYKEQKRLQREPLLCVSCKIKNKKVNVVIIVAENVVLGVKYINKLFLRIYILPNRILGTPRYLEFSKDASVFLYL
jgi:hypothetical protein